MKKVGFYKSGLAICFTWLLLVLGIQKSSAQEICIANGGSDQRTGTQNGFRYELWNQNAQGTACMTLGDGALFSGEWSDIENYLARRGLGYDQTEEHQEVGRFYATYDCDYNPSSASGNSYLSIYGWTVDPLIEFYIIEDWRNWIPSMAGGASSKGSFNANGGTYEIIENTRTNQPSIVGNTTFQQYFSIRTSVRNKGTINISDHFDKWESLGMELGKLHEVSFVVEGYQSSGSFEFTELDVYVNNDPVVLGVEGSELAPLTIYPNPNSGSVSIKLDKSISNASINIYDALGKVVFSQEKFNGNMIHVSDLEGGIYIVNVNNNTRNYESKLIVY